jgi:transketolase
MRTAFINELTAQARINPSLFLLVGDIGFSVVEAFAKEFPDRFLNVGVAEANMIGVASGLALEGYHVFTYSIANFSTLRCIEQIRNDVGYHELPVTVVSVGAGVAYGNLGYSHHAVQDIGVVRALGSIAILSPADPGESRECVEWIVNNPRPSYLRIGKAGEAALHDKRGIAGGPIEVRKGEGEIALVSTGSVLAIAIEAARLAEETGKQVSVFSCPWLHPVGPEFFAPLRGFKHIVAIEEHLPYGGLASILRDSPVIEGKVHSVSLRPELAGEVGSQHYLREISGINGGAIRDLIMSLN